MPFSGETQIKFSGAYPLPWWGLQASAAVQNLSGRPISATYAATSAQILPSLHRNLAACGVQVVCTQSVTINLIEPNTMFEDRYTLADVRLSKNIVVARWRIQPRLDVYNLFNSSAVNSLITRYGGTWLQPQEVFGARMAKFGVQIDF